MGARTGGAVADDSDGPSILVDGLPPSADGRAGEPVQRSGENDFPAHRAWLWCPNETDVQAGCETRSDDSKAPVLAGFSSFSSWWGPVLSKRRPGPLSPVERAEGFGSSSGVTNAVRSGQHL